MIEYIIIVQDMECVMGLIDRLGGLQKVRQKSQNSDKSIEELVNDAIEVQKDILDGKNPTNNKGNSIKSWFRNGQMTPVVTNLNFFRDTPSLDIGREDPKTILGEFQKEFNAGEYKSYVSDLQKRIDERNIKLRKARSR